MTNREEAIGNASAALSERGWGIREAPQHVASVPGLYAIHAAPVTWEELGLASSAGVPLYVGKSEGSLVTRELEGHFASNPQKPARTGNSTVRRSFASLLRTPLSSLGDRAVTKGRSPSQRRTSRTTSLMSTRNNA